MPKPPESIGRCISCCTTPQSGTVRRMWQRLLHHYSPCRDVLRQRHGDFGCSALAVAVWPCDTLGVGAWLSLTSIVASLTINALRLDDVLSGKGPRLSHLSHMPHSAACDHVLTRSTENCTDMNHRGLNKTRRIQRNVNA